MGKDNSGYTVAAVIIVVVVVVFFFFRGGFNLDIRAPPFPTPTPGVTPTLHPTSAPSPTPSPTASPMVADYVFYNNRDDLFPSWPMYLKLSDPYSYPVTNIRYKLVDGFGVMKYFVFAENIVNRWMTDVWWIDYPYPHYVVVLPNPYSALDPLWPIALHGISTNDVPLGFYREHFEVQATLLAPGGNQTVTWSVPVVIQIISPIVSENPAVFPVYG